MADGKGMHDEQLVRRSKGGDRDAFGQLVARYQNSVYRVVRGVLADPAECEDVAQEVFLKAYASLAKFRGEAGFFTWLYRIAVNEALRHRKRRAFSNADALPEVEAPSAPEMPDEDAPTLRTLEKLLRKLELLNECAERNEAAANRAERLLLQKSKASEARRSKPAGAETPLELTSTQRPLLRVVLPAGRRSLPFWTVTRNTPFSA